MPVLFSYGTLQDERVQRATFGRLLRGRHDALPGFDTSQVLITDPAVVAATGLTHYQNAVGTGRGGASLPGMALEVTDAELATADEYERPAGYARMPVVLASGTPAWVYVCAPQPLNRARAISGYVGAVLWRRLDQPGHDAARLLVGDAGVRIDGTAVFIEDGRVCRLHYLVTCDAAWRTRTAQVEGWCGAGLVDLQITAGDDGGWTLNGRDVPEVRGCVDVDLSFTPATNVLPLRRLAPAIGTTVDVRAAWLRFPELTLEPLDQTYERVTAGRYRYEVPATGFTAMVEVDAASMVVEYSALWQAEPD